ncbi:MAG: hypothetical protein ACM369_03595, partial [Acidobacteriota bacterium]
MRRPVVIVGDSESGTGNGGSGILGRAGATVSGAFPTGGETRAAAVGAIDAAMAEPARGAIG